jgi:hypothetical protein
MISAVDTLVWTWFLYAFFDCNAGVEAVNWWNWTSSFRILALGIAHHVFLQQRVCGSRLELELCHKMECMKWLAMNISSTCITLFFAVYLFFLFPFLKICSIWPGIVELRATDIKMSRIESLGLSCFLNLSGRGEGRMIQYWAFELISRLGGVISLGYLALSFIPCLPPYRSRNYMVVMVLWYTNLIKTAISFF